MSKSLAWGSIMRKRAKVRKAPLFLLKILLRGIYLWSSSVTCQIPMTQWLWSQVAKNWLLTYGPPWKKQRLDGVQHLSSLLLMNNGEANSCQIHGALVGALRWHHWPVGSLGEQQSSHVDSRHYRRLTQHGLPKPCILDWSQGVLILSSNWRSKLWYTLIQSKVATRSWQPLLNLPARWKVTKGLYGSLQSSYAGDLPSWWSRGHADHKIRNVPFMIYFLIG